LRTFGDTAAGFGAPTNALNFAATNLQMIVAFETWMDFFSIHYVIFTLAVHARSTSVLFELLLQIRSFCPNICYNFFSFLCKRQQILEQKTSLWQSLGYSYILRT
jgi:hypothetical protein